PACPQAASCADARRVLHAPPYRTPSPLRSTQHAARSSRPPYSPSAAARAQAQQTNRRTRSTNTRCFLLSRLCSSLSSMFKRAGIERAGSVPCIMPRGDGCARFCAAKRWMFQLLARRTGPFNRPIRAYEVTKRAFGHSLRASGVSFRANGVSLRAFGVSFAPAQVPFALNEHPNRANETPNALFEVSLGANGTPFGLFEVSFGLFEVSFALFEVSFGLFEVSFGANETPNAPNETLFAPAKWSKTAFPSPFVPFPDGKSADNGRPRRYRPVHRAKSFITLRRAGSARR